MLAALPPGHRQPLSHQARWLFRTLHAAELAGLDPAEVIRTAIASRDLAGARDIAAVLDARIRPRVHPLLPQPQGSWAERVPRLPDPGRQAYLAQIAAMMDDRTQRLGQHAAQTSPAWAVTALGPVPADPAARRAWEHKAAAIAAYREMYGYDHPDDPIGPEPSRESTRPAGRLAPGLRRPRPGRRPRRPGHARRAAVAAPRHLRRRDRLGTPPRRKGTAAGPARRLRRRPGRHPRRRRSRTPPARPATTTAPRRHETLAASYRALRDLYQQREQTLAQAMADRQEWEHATAGPGAWPSPPTPNCAAATPARRSSPCAPPNQPPPATPNASN